MRAHKAVKVLLCLLGVVLIVAASVAVGWKLADRQKYNAFHKYPLLDPSVSNPTIHQEIINFDPLRQDIKKYLASLNLSHSFYFEYLPNGINIRDGDDNISRAASLIKTPLIMDLYKLSERGKINLDKTVTVAQTDINTDPEWGNPTNLKPGDSLTIRKAAEITLQRSDNTTLNVIKDQINSILDGSSDSFTSLDLPYSVGGPSDQQILISARSYSSVLKCLYYACFNSPEDSSQILNYLIGSADDTRLVSGVPSNIKVAHKVGASNIAQSDCGIIYYPGKPYLVCLMFFNLPTDTTTTDAYFQHVSDEVYQYIMAAGH